MLEEQESRQQPVESTEVDGPSVPLSVQTGQLLIDPQADMQTFMSPVSQDASNYSSAFGGGEASEQRRGHHDLSLDHSLDASNSTKNQRKKQHQMTNAEMRDLPGGPLLESAKSQKQFIIKKQQQKGSKQRGKSKGVTLMKAYFPNLVAKKDMNLASPVALNSVANAAQRESIGGVHHHSNSAKDSLGKRLARHSNSMQASHAGAQFIDPSHLHASDMALHQYHPHHQVADLTNKNQFFSQVDTNGSLIIIDDQPRSNPAGLSQDQPFLPLRKQRSQNRGDLAMQHQPNGSALVQKRVRRNSLAEGDRGSATGKDARNNNHMLPPIFSGPQKKASQKAAKLIPMPQKSQYRSQMSDSSPMQYKQDVIVQQQQSFSDRNPAMVEARASTLDDQGPSSQPQMSKKMVTSGERRHSTELSPCEDNIDDEQYPGQGMNAQLPPKGGKKDFVKANEERLRLMQDQRAAELKNIEDQRARLLRRQEKLKNNVLRDAQAYRAKKAERAEQPLDEIQINNVKNADFQQPQAPRQPALSPMRDNSNNEGLLQGLTSPKVNRAATIPQDDDKTADEKAEEKKKMDMMRKFYRNRYNSFLQALAEQKSKKEQEEKAIKEAAEKKKQKVTQKVLGDVSRVRSKLFDSQARTNEEMEEQLPAAMISVKDFNATSKSTTNTRSNSKQVRQIKRGNSVSSLSAAEKAYNDGSTNVSSGQKCGQMGSRGSTRAASSKGDGSERKANVAAAQQANRSAQNFSRGHTLTPKVVGSKASQAAAAAQAEPEMTPEEKLEFDEKREEEILKEAAERKARALAIRERQEKQLQAIRDKVSKQKETEQAELERKKKMQEAAREQVQQRAEQIRNFPSLREQQDSRLKQKRNEEESKKEVASPTPAKPRPPVESEAFNNFLERNKQMMAPAKLNITDMKEWKKKNRVEPDTKVFLVKGGYGDVKRALKSRGWVENKDKESPCFDLLWTLMTKDVIHSELSSHQIVNHFSTATSITTKVGLTHSLKNLIWFNAVDIDTFYPRCYDLAITEELEDFIQEFKQVKAVSYLKIYVREMREAFAASGNSMSEEIKSHTVSDKIYKIVMKICKNRTRDLDDLIDDPDGFEALVNDKEWQILSQDEHSEVSLAEKKHNEWMKKQQEQAANGSQPAKKGKKSMKKDSSKAGTAAGGKKTGAAGGGEAAAAGAQDDEDEYGEEYDDEYGDYDEEDDEGADEEAAEGVAQGGEEEKEAVFAQNKLTVKQKQADPHSQSLNSGSCQNAQSNCLSQQSSGWTDLCFKGPDKLLGERYPKFAEAVRVLDVLREKYPQFNLDGERNIWIMKPAGSSRGRGICLKRDLCEILDMIKHKDNQQAISNQKNGQLYICQKYIEHTLLMKCRKFDIRQWVLVTDWNPLTIWIYAEPYIRFPAADFDFSKISNRYAHLSNNSIAKHGKKQKITHHIDGNMWDLETFQTYLLDTYGSDVWEDKISESIKNIVINSLESVQDNFESKKGIPFEMFGYDIMVDDDFNCWLIEVNSSPAMDYSTSVTERLVKMVLEDTIKVVVDYGMASAKKQKKVDTGGFECVYKAKRIVDKPMNSFGLNMEVHGKKIPKSHLKKY